VNRRAFLALATASVALGCRGAAAAREVVLATTTSVQDTGLLDVLLPDFERRSPFRVKTIAVGSGQALAMGERGEADVLLAHAPDAEKKIVATGAVVDRRLVMHNDFVLVGPPASPVRLATLRPHEALLAIRAAAQPFFSRGDGSGTHQLEMRLWRQAGVEPSGAFYHVTGGGMGQTLLIASERRGFTLTDRGTFLVQARSLALEVALEGAPELVNPYHVMRVNPDRFSRVNAEGARAFASYLLSPDGQNVIADFGRASFGRPLFVADRGRQEADLGS
jgi:tungstate transport system substrate-binding protein